MIRLSANTATVGRAIRERYAGLVDRVSLATAFVFGEEEWTRVADDLRRAFMSGREVAGRSASFGNSAMKTARPAASRPRPPVEY